MPTFPLSLETLVGKPLMYLIFGVIGLGFGFTLEISGFGDSRKLAAQFYFKELTVLKVMFTAIVVAMVLIFIMVGLGILDYNQIWVNPTYLWSGIVGGLIMGVGFIIGGFCPGTSLVSAVTFKLDGVFFVLGGLVGIFLFGETVGFYEDWWNGSYFGRLTIMDWLNLPTGVVVVGLILMALFMFWGSEQLERLVGKRDLKKEPRLRYVGAGTLFAGALAVLFIGQPTLAEQWARVAPAQQPKLAQRQVQIEAGELLVSLADDRLNIVMLDVRSETDYNLFHIRNAQYIGPGDLTSYIPRFITQSTPNTVYVVMSNDETAATEAWKILTASSVPNVYILQGGVNKWIEVFGKEDTAITPTAEPANEDLLAYTFNGALGDRYLASDPVPHEWKLEYVPKIQLQLKRDKSGGGCG
jgi:rhodanese-related sulfurtransferase